MCHLTIDGRSIGPGLPTFVIAEIGVNHDGSVERALELVAHAADVGADAVKLQLFSADRLVHASAAAASYQTDNCGATDQATLLRSLELDPSEVERVVAAIRKAGLCPIATPFSIADVDLIERLVLPAVKLASPDLVNWPLLERVARTGQPMLLSCGAATLDEVDATVRKLADHPFALLHCVSAYPTPPEVAHLAWIRDLTERYPTQAIGYSDHTEHWLSGALAVAAGACVIEKHLTWNRDAVGPDHRASFDPIQFKTYVELIRQADRLMGAGARSVLPIEADVRRLSRQSVVLRRPLPAGKRIERADLEVRRPGTGIPAAAMEAVIGRRLRLDLPADTLLQWDMLDGEADA